MFLKRSLSALGAAAILAATTVMPAFADDIEIDNESMCVIGTLGTSENDSTANVEALWTGNQYTCVLGQYLDATTATLTTCPAGSYCDSTSTVTYNGANQCITACPTGYTNSAAGTTSQNDCYNPGTATCSTRNPYNGANPTKVTSVTYGNSTNGTATCKTYYGDTTTCVLDASDACDITDIACATGYRKTTLPGSFIANSDLASYASGSNPDWGTNIKFRALNGDSGANSGSGSYSSLGSSSGMTNGTWSVAWNDGTVVHGHATCNAISGTYATPTDNSFTAGQYNDSDARYCWCQMDGYSLQGGASVVSAGAWVFRGDVGDASGCAGSCANNCARGVQFRSAFRAAVFGSLGAGGLECTANTINLNWFADTVANGATTPLTVQSAAQQCTYDQSITLPSPNPTKTGYTFSGWRLRQ